MGDVKLVDSMMSDGLIDAFHGYHMGITGKSINLIFFPVGTLLISYSQDKLCKLFPQLSPFILPFLHQNCGNHIHKKLSKSNYVGVNFEIFKSLPTLCYEKVTKRSVKNIEEDNF